MPKNPPLLFLCGLNKLRHTCWPDSVLPCLTISRGSSRIWRSWRIRAQWSWTFPEWHIAYEEDSFGFDVRLRGKAVDDYRLMLDQNLAFRLFWFRLWLAVLFVETSIYLHYRLQLFESAKREVIADIQFWVQKLDEFLRIVLLVEDLLAQEGLLALHVVHLPNYKILRVPESLADKEGGIIERKEYTCLVKDGQNMIFIYRECISIILLNISSQSWADFIRPIL